MSGTITLTAAMRANLQSLKNTGAELATTQLNLSTGNKVNSALDNPVNFFASQALNNRASSLSALLDGMGQGVSALQTASQGITSVTSLVNQLTSIANQANQDLSTVSTQNIVAPLTAAAGMASGTVAALGVTSVLTLTPTNGTAASFSVTPAESANTLVSQINATTGFSAALVMGNGTNTLPNGIVMTAGKAYLEITSTNGDGAITTTDSTAGTLLTALGLPGASTSYTVGGAANDQTNFGNVVTQINQLVADSSYQGTNLLTGAAGSNLVVNFSTSSSITVNKTDITTASTGLNLTAQNVSTAGGVTAALAAITTALTTLQSAASGFSNSLSMIQTRQDFTSNLINTLQNGATSLVIADKNQEGANMLALQTQQQLGIEALSLSSQANQSVLRLFA